MSVAGLTSTIPTVRFSPREIVRSDDALADNPTKRVLDFPRPEEKSMNRNPQKSRAPVMNDVSSSETLKVLRA